MVIMRNTTVLNVKIDKELKEEEPLKELYAKYDKEKNLGEYYINKK